MERVREDAQGSATPTRAEILGALSLAIDLGLGLPLEHVLRSALIADRLADRLGCDEDQRAAAFYVTLVMWVGCHADSHEYSRWFGDDIAVRRDSYLVDWNGFPYARFLLQNLGRGQPLPHRIMIAGALLRNTRGNLARMVGSHCTSAGLLAERIGLGAPTRDALTFTFERWDGKGLPQGVSGEAIPVSMRIAHVADISEVYHRLHGTAGAIENARRRSGGQFDPAVVDALVLAPEEVLVPPSMDVWREAADRAPDARHPVQPHELAELMTALGDFVDLKSPYTAGHSRGVAELVAAAASRAGIPAQDADLLARAGHVHDLGRIGVSNLIWEKTAPLGAAERERINMHPYLTGRILSKVAGLSSESALAANHHERLDGSGYPRGLSGGQLSMQDQLLAAAELFQSSLEPRPYRAAYDRAGAVQRLRDAVAAKQLRGDAVEAVLIAAGESAARRGTWPDGLTNREVEILRLVARAQSTRDIAHSLSLSEKTVRNHLEHVFTKIGVSSRVGASLYAVDHGLVGRAAGGSDGSGE